MPFRRNAVLGGLAAVVIGLSSGVARAQDNTNDFEIELVPLTPTIPLEPLPGTRLEEEEPPEVTNFATVTPVGEALKTCVEMKECYYQALAQYSNCYFDAAAKLFLQTYELADKDNPNKSKLLRNAAAAYENAGDPNNALLYYREYLRVESSPLGKSQITSRVAALRLYAKGLDLMQQEETVAAVRNLETAETFLHSNNPPLLLCRDLGNAYEQAGRTKEALRRYRVCLSQRTTPSLKEFLEERITALTSAELVSLPPEQPSFLSQHWPSLTAVGTGLLAASVGAYLNGAANDQFEGLIGTCGQTPLGCSTSQIDELKNSYQNRDITYGVGIAAGVTAGGLFLWESLRNPATSDKPAAHNFKLAPGGFTLQF